ncbi:hypothetical protein [Amycolatopsis methanolica]|uniref:Uncharacterized protein n=1 Tax=Amycolatopsis methanolica 239 TaxID=1068978 RepID=A0A076MSW8_AMYME|nr:hypothetical protein [Amycolatopsis methanolica]AIJ20882.1 hypothetical protein AMETH_0790 [Amycolatopsis methanolica 239]
MTIPADFSAEMEQAYSASARTPTASSDPFDALYEPPEVIAPLPLTGNGVAAIRDWLVRVERHFGGQGMATCHYAALLGYWANLRTFRVEISDRKLSEAIGAHRDRLTGHAQRLVDAGFLARRPKRARERGTQYVLSVPEAVKL